MLMEIFHDNTGIILDDSWAVVLDVSNKDSAASSTMVKIRTIRRGKGFYHSSWVYVPRAEHIVAMHNLKILNRCGRPLPRVFQELMRD